MGCSTVFAGMESLIRISVDLTQNSILINIS